MAGAYILSRLSAPIIRYNRLLESHPLTTKSVTSGVMYAAGDLFAQFGEHYVASKASPPSSPPPAFSLSWKRLGVFFVYGTLIAGPLYHAWFGYLDTLPGIMFRLRSSRVRREILSAYALLKRHGIEVHMKPEALPSAKPFSKWTEKAVKIGMDQFVFSSSYTLLFFVCVGMMTGGVDKYVAENRRHNVEEVQALVQSKYRASSRELHRDLMQLKEKLRSGGDGGEEEDHESIDRVLELLKAEQEATVLTWGQIWDRTWSHTREVYWTTYLFDCLFWPGIQAVNFTFVPLKYQVLYVNGVNLIWNTFLSFMANQSH